jgi:hypothetical protein
MDVVLGPSVGPTLEKSTTYVHPSSPVVHYPNRKIKNRRCEETLILSLHPFHGARGLSRREQGRRPAGSLPSLLTRGRVRAAAYEFPPPRYPPEASQSKKG